MADKKKKISTIKLEKQTKERLEKLKEYKKESYNEIIKKMLHILNTLKIDAEKAHIILDKIDTRIQEKQPST